MGQSKTEQTDGYSCQGSLTPEWTI